MTSTELVQDRTQKIPFTHTGRELKARPMPLRLALSLETPGDDGGIGVSIELMAQVISECVLFADSNERVFTPAEILESDTTAMMPLFKSVTDLFSSEDAGKN